MAVGHDTSPSLIFAHLPSKAKVPIWRRFLLTSPPLSSRSSISASLACARSPLHTFYNSSFQRRNLLAGLAAQCSDSIYLFDVSVVLYPDVGGRTYSLWLCIQDPYLGRQGAFAAHVLNVLRPVLSKVVHLTLEYREGVSAIEFGQRDHQPDRTDWRKILWAFVNVKTLSMHNGLVQGVSSSLLFDGGESSEYLLPELNKLECYGSGDASDAFAPFIDARKNVGRLLTLIRFENFPIHAWKERDSAYSPPSFPTPFLWVKLRDVCTTSNGWCDLNTRHASRVPMLPCTKSFIYHSDYLLTLTPAPLSPQNYDHVTLLVKEDLSLPHPA